MPLGVVDLDLHPPDAPALRPGHPGDGPASGRGRRAAVPGCRSADPTLIGAWAAYPRSAQYASYASNVVASMPVSHLQAET